MYELGESPEAAPSLAELQAFADELLRRAADPTQEFNPNVDVSVAEGRAVFRTQHSPTKYNQMAISRSEYGVVLEQQSQRPSVEVEGFGLTLRSTYTYPLHADEYPTLVQEKGRLQSNGTLEQVEHPQVEMGDPLDEAACVRLLGTLKVISGEDLSEVRMPRRGGWLASLMRARR